MPTLAKVVNIEPSGSLLSNWQRSGWNIANLVLNSLARDEEHAKNVLRHMKKAGILYTGKRHKPQIYYLTECRSTIEWKNAHNGVSVVDSNMELLNEIKKQSLEGYVLPLLKGASAHIHRLQFKIEVMDGILYDDVYSYFSLPSTRFERQNGAKSFERRVGNYFVKFVLFPNSVIMVFANSSRHPHRLLTDEDHLNLLAFLGQIKQELCSAIQDRHERMIPPISQWLLTSCDINKDIRVSDNMHFTGLKIQVKHLDHVFRAYIKDMGDRTVCRVEESFSPNKPAIEFIHEEFTKANLANRVHLLEEKIRELESIKVAVSG